MENTSKKYFSHVFLYSPFSTKNACNYQVNDCNYTFTSLNYNAISIATNISTQGESEVGPKLRENACFSKQYLCVIKELIHDKKKIKQGDKDLLLRLDTYIVSNYMNESLRIMDIAKNVHSSIRRLQSKCKELTGFTPHKLLIHYRLNEAIYLLCTTDSQINHVSVNSGFADCSSFHRIFKRHFELTPMCYRKKHRIIKQQT